MIFLPDVNVWLALVTAEHVHSRQAREFLDEHDEAVLALCRVTHMAILRLLTNSHVMGPDVRSAKEAWEISDRLLDQPNVVFAKEPSALDAAWKEITPPAQRGPNFWTDAYLAAFSRVTGYTLVTFDRGFSAYRQVPLRILGAGSYGARPNRGKI